MISISNGQLSVGVKPKGAELCSIRSADGTEYIWQAAPAFWNRHAPILFPMVGKLRDGRYTLDGKPYELSPHGFARDLEFAVIEQSAQSMVFQLLPTAATRAAYPFEFSLTITYRLSGNRLSIEYTVRNTGSSLMPFSIGTHPAFNLHGPLEECSLEFGQPETVKSYLVNTQGLVSKETGAALTNSTTLPLSQTIFDRDVLIFLDAKSDQITLKAKNSPHRLTMDFPGFPQLGIWSKPGAPFVCIEPWYGYSDPETPYGELWNKPGLLKLEAGKTFACTHGITVDA
jgi:galactose mutarotase-like enzyme